MATLVQRQKAMPTNFGKPIPMAEGPRTFGVTFDFTAAPGTQTFALDNASMGVTSIQSVFIDNSNNSSTALFSVNGSPQIINMPPFSQGIMPLLLAGDTGINVTVVTAGTVKIPVLFMNVQHDGLIWSAQGNVIVGTVAVSGAITANNPTAVPTSKAGAIAAGGASQQLMAANGARKGLMIQNPTDEVGQGGIAAREALYLNFGASAAGVDDGISIELQPGGALFLTQGAIPTSAINVTAATIGHKFIAFEFN